MKIKLVDIYPNPYRDLEHNPINREQVEKIAESISRTGFWDNVVVRENPDMPGEFQLAYGHNRLAALGCPNISYSGKSDFVVEFAEFIVKELNDYDMLSAMVDENATQGKITPAVAFENVLAAVRLAEQLLDQCETVEEFNEAAKNSQNSRCRAPYNGQNGKIWRLEEFTKAKEALAGEGLGRGFLTKFIPNGSRVDGNTIQTVLDSHYKDRREEAAQREAEQAAIKRKQREEAERAAEAKRRQRELELEAERQRLAEEERKARQREREAGEARERERAAKAAERAARNSAKAEEERQRLAEERRKAQQAQREAEELEAKRQKEAEKKQFSGVARHLLERLPTPTHMRLIADAIKVEKIPAEHHEALIDECLAQEWVARSNRTPGQTSIIIPEGVHDWWYRISGRAIRDRSKARKDSNRWRQKDVTLVDFGGQLSQKIRAIIKEIEAITPFADQVALENPRLFARLEEGLGLLHEVTGKGIQAFADTVVEEQ